MSHSVSDQQLSVHLENIGGIETASVDLPPGVTVLSGRNATNRTSFLQGIMATMGSDADQISLKSDAETGRAAVQIGDKTYTRELSRTNSGISTDGDPYTTNAELIDLYAFLLRENPVRQTVERDGNLYDVLMRPIDTDEIDTEIDRIRGEIQEAENELDTLSEYKNRLPQLEENRTEVTRTLTDLQEHISELETRKATLEERFETDEFSEDGEIITELEQELTELRTDATDIERQIEQQRNIRNAAEKEIESVETPSMDETELNRERERLETEREVITDRIETLRSTRQQITTGMEAARALQDSTTSIAEEISNLDFEISIPSGPLTDGESGGDSENVTDALVDGEMILCRVCGSKTSTETIAAVIDQYRELNTTFREQVRELEETKRELRSELQDVSQTVEEWENAKTRRNEARRQKERASETIAELEDRKSEIEQRIDSLETELETARKNRSTDDEEIQEEYSTIETQLIDARVERKHTESRLDTIESEIDDIEARLDRKDQLNSRHDRLVEELNALQSRVDDTERELVESFNETMTTILDLLEYENIERVWIERKVRPNSSKRATDEQTVFVLNIVREGSDGVYADELQHLSESERSVIGLVVALTGYIVHDVVDECPVMVLDSVEMIDSQRISRLIEFLSQQTDHFIAALLPEDSTEVAESVTDASVINLSDSIS